MAGDTVIMVIGNLTAAPELRFTPNGDAVANFTVASTPRAFDRQANEWKDQETLFLRCSVWREAAENVAESLDKGTRVIVQGRLKARSYETKEGERRTSMELEVDEVGPSMRYATARVAKNTGGGNQGGGFGGGQGGYQGGGFGGNQGGGFGGGQGGYNADPRGGGNDGGGFAPDPRGGGNPQGGQQGNRQAGPQGGGQQGNRQGGGQQGGDPWNGQTGQPWQNQPGGGFDGVANDEPPF